MPVPPAPGCTSCAIALGRPPNRGAAGRRRGPASRARGSWWCCRALDLAGPERRRRQRRRRSRHARRRRPDQAQPGARGRSAGRLRRRGGLPRLPRTTRTSVRPDDRPGADRRVDPGRHRPLPASCSPAASGGSRVARGALRSYVQARRPGAVARDRLAAASGDSSRTALGEPGARPDGRRAAPTCSARTRARSSATARPRSS